jgi:hypothetical protein
MSNTFEVLVDPSEKTNRQDYGCPHAPDYLDTSQPRDNSVSLKASGILPHLDIGGSVSSIRNCVSGVAKDATQGAGSVLKMLGHGVAEAAETIVHIPAKDWAEVGKGAATIAQKDGTSLALDIILVAKTKGTNLASDAKFGLDLVSIAVSPEGKDLGHKVAKAWTDGEKARKKH